MAEVQDTTGKRLSKRMDLLLRQSVRGLRGRTGTLLTTDWRDRMPSGFRKCQFFLLNMLMLDATRPCCRDSGPPLTSIR